MAMEVRAAPVPSGRSPIIAARPMTARQPYPAPESTVKTITDAAGLIALAPSRQSPSSSILSSQAQNPSVDISSVAFGPGAASSLAEESARGGRYLLVGL